MLYAFDLTSASNKRITTKYIIMKNLTRKFRFVYSFLLGILFLPNLLLSQEKTIVLKDVNLNEPVTYAHYTYGSESGVSDSNGVIQLKKISESDLLISHIQYGYVTIKPVDLERYMNGGSVSLQKQSTILQPAIVMGLHNSQYPDNNLEINYSDLLSHDAGAYLERTPSITSVKKSGAYGFDPVFRGFKDERLNIIIDGGQNATAACPNRMDPPSSQVSLNMMERVEILKGPFSLRYGNSFGGTIHFITEAPSFTEKTDLFGRISGSYEGNGGVGRGETMLGASGSWYNVKGFGAYSQGSNYTNGEGEEVLASFERLTWGGSADFKLTNNQTLSFSANNNVANDVDFPSLPMDLRSDNTLLVNAKHQVRFNSQTVSAVNTMLYGSFVDHVMDNYNKIIDPRMVDAITEATTDNYGGRSEVSMSLKSGYLYTGIDLQRTEQDGDRRRTFLMGPNMGNTAVDNVWQGAVMTKTGVFAEYHNRFSQVKMVAAIRLDANSSELTRPADEFIANYKETSRNQSNISVSFGANKAISESVELGLWLGRAQRSGSLTELYINYFPVGLDAYEMLGNPELNAEVNNQADILFHWTTSSTRVEIDLFASFLQDYISSEVREDLSPRMMSAPGVRQYKNIDKAYKAGFEFSWTQILPAKLEQRLVLVYTYAEDLTINKPLPEIPPLELNYILLGRYLSNKLIPELSLRYAASQDRVSEEFAETTTPEFFLVDIKVAYEIIPKLQVAAGVKNVFDRAYYEHLSRATKVSDKRPLYSPGRNIFASVSYAF